MQSVCVCSSVLACKSLSLMSASDAAASGGSGTRPPKRALKVSYQSMHERNIHNVKLLVSTVIPVTYQDSLFKRILAFPPEYCKLGM